MRRQTIYFDQIPLETDLLHAEQDAMIGLAKLSAGVMGTSVTVNGFTCTPTTPASLSVLLTSGEIYQVENLEATAWSSLNTDTHSIIKQGILLDPLTFGITPPGTVGFSQVFLIEVQYQDVDSGLTVLPYYNANTPSLPFSGPGNTGTAQNTFRDGAVAAQVKAGTAAATGTQVAPTVDAGWTGLFLVTVANGALTITSGNITQVPNAPFVIAPLPKIPAGVQAGSWTYCVDFGTVSSIAVAPIPAPAAYTAGMGLLVKAAAIPNGATTINVIGNAGVGLGAVGVVHGDGSVIVANDWAAGSLLGLYYDGANFQVCFKGQAELQAPTFIAPRTYFVNASTGSDSNNGLSSGTAFLTIQKAINTMNSYNTNGFNVTINVANGTYPPFVCPPINGSGSCAIVGNIVTPSSVLIHATAGEAVAVTGYNYFLQGMKFQADTDGAVPHIGAGVRCDYGVVFLRDCEFGTCSSYHMLIGGLCAVDGTSSGVSGAFLNFTGNAGIHSMVANGGQITLNTPVLNYTGTLTWGAGTGATAWAGNNGKILGSSSSVVTGSVTGVKFTATANGVINTNGSAGTNFAGSGAGGTSFGGQCL